MSAPDAPTPRAGETRESALAKHQHWCDFRLSVEANEPPRPCDCWLDDSPVETTDDRK